MTEHKTTRNLKINTPAIYRIRVQGKLEPYWSENLGGMQITIIEKEGSTTETLLVGRISDQAALSGALNTLYDMHFPVLSVECLEKLEE
jgi:hypothetical protein